MQRDNVDLDLETQDLIERVPDRFNTWLVYFFLSIILTLLLASILIKSPDIVVAKVRISSSRPPIVLKAKTSGKISLLVDSLPMQCDPNQYIAMIENSADPEAVCDLKQFLCDFSPLQDYDKPLFKTDKSLGELSADFYSFIKYVDDYKDIMSDYNQYIYELNSVASQMITDSLALALSMKLLKSDKARLAILKENFCKDSILLSENAVLENVVNQSYLAYIEANNNIMSEENKIEVLTRNYADAKRKKHNIEYQYAMNRQSIANSLVTTYNSLCAHLQIWENNYIFKTDDKATIEFANLISDNSFIVAGDPAFTIIQANNAHFGIAILPSTGAGMVKRGQKVNIKIEAFPFEEYGMLIGCVDEVSKNVLEENGYLVYIQLPSGLISNTGKGFQFAESMYGTAEIITEDKRLIEKIFYHVKKILSRKND